MSRRRRIRITFGFDLSTAPVDVQMDAVRTLLGRQGHVRRCSNWVFERRNDPAQQKYFDWDVALESGRDYLVGSEVPMPRFIRTHRGSCTPWQQIACLMCWQNHELSLNVGYDWPRLDYDIYWRGQYVEIGLPHQDAGGEKHWISKPPFKTKILVNVD